MGWGSALWRLLLLLCLVASSLLVMGSSFSLARASSCWGNEAVPAARLPAEFCGWVWAEGLADPRGVEAVSNGDVLVLERALAQVTALFDANGDGHSDPQERAVIAKAPDINHAILVHEGYLYASSASTVYRWKYQPGQRAPLGDYIVVVRDIPTCCDHVTRTILFDKENRLYIQLGSGSNVDPDSRQARIHRWNATAIPDGGFVWTSGELFADGLRNEVGLRNDKFGRIWGVENGIDNLYRQSLGGDIHNNNPSEELNLFLPERPGMFYGYPYCWSQFNLTFGKPGTQWVTNEFLNDTIHSDAWCQNRTNVEPPALNMPAHYAPLDIIFYDKANGAFPASLDGDAFVACHGSWDRDVPAGYKVLHVIFNQETGQPIDYRPFFEYKGPGDTGPDWPHRPVGLTFGKCANAGSCLFVSSDASGSIIAIAAEAHVLLKEQGE